MTEFASALFVMFVGTALAGFQAARFPREEARLLIASFVAHIGSAFVQVWITGGVYGGGDIFGYTGWGELLAAALRADFAQFAPEMAKLFFHLPAVIPAMVPGVGTSTGSMAAVAGVLTFLTGGGAYTLCLVVAVMAYFGQVALYRAFRDALPAVHHRRMLIAALLVPSEVFWSSGVLKEAVAVIGLGYLMLGLERSILRRITMGSLVMIAAGVLLVSMLKAYILMATVAALAAGIYYRSGKGPSRFGRPVQLVVALGVAGACYLVLAQALPQYSVDNVAEQAAFYQEQGQEFTGGSSYSMGDGTSRTLGGQLVYAPLALGTAVFRPLLIEAKNPLILVNALETSAALFVFFRALSRRGVKGSWAFLTSNGMLMFCLTFVVVFGTGVGLTTTNLGSLSRYRMPLIPFLWVLLMTLDVPQTRTASQGVAPRNGRRLVPVGATRRA